MTTAQPLDQWPKWRDTLVYHLRMKDVPGDRIGDILLEVDTHLRDSGDSPDEAFGPAKHYAEERAAAAGYDSNEEDEGEDSNLLLIAFGSFAGAALYTDGAMSIGKGSDAMFGLNAWIALTLGVAILVIGLIRLPVDLVRHPATGEPLLGDTTRVRWIVGGILVLLGVAFYFVGRTLAG